ncbi:MAG: DALR anticodon-binding domain-containing protein [Sneathiella sp.]
MSENYIQSIKNVLETLIDGKADALGLERVTVKDALTLRPPRNENWGDLCTNILLVLCAEDSGKREALAPAFLGGLKEIPTVSSATLSGAGYINIKIRPDYWAEQLPDILNKGIEYGLGAGAPGADIIVTRPEHAEDLLSARQLWNGEVLEKLARLSNADVTFEPWHADDAKGFATSVAAAKCTYSRLRLALLSNGSDFAKNFSPVLAVDRAYSNPVFCIPFAHARITALMDTIRKDVIAKKNTDLELVEVLGELNLSVPIEQKIAKFLCHWPMTVTKTLNEGDAVYLATYLHDLSLLFFQLVKDVRPQSTEYLTEKNTNVARQVLLQTIDKLICGGLDLLGIDRVEELN